MGEIVDRQGSDAGVGRRGVGSVTDGSVTAACAQGADPLAIQR